MLEGILKIRILKCIKMSVFGDYSASALNAIFCAQRDLLRLTISYSASIYVHILILLVNSIPYSEYKSTFTSYPRQLSIFYSTCYFMSINGDGSTNTPVNNLNYHINTKLHTRHTPIFKVHQILFFIEARWNRIIS